MRTIFEHERCVLLHGDAADLGEILPENSVDAVVTDPPAGIGYMSRSWDKDRGGRDAWIAWLARTLAPSLRALKPGGHALVWALPRTSHWTAMALELAGFEIRDRVSAVFGSGYPKSLNISKAIDAHHGKTSERPVVGKIAAPCRTRDGSPALGGGWQASPDRTGSCTAAAAAAWEGWGTALKPAMEDWWLARKPLDGTHAECVLRWGTGAINIDGCRVGGDRWPAHLILGDEEAAGLLDEQAGERKSGATSDAPRSGSRTAVYGAAVGPRSLNPRAGSTGGASRFFYCPKAPRSERDAGLDHLPMKTGGEATGREDDTAGVQNPRAGAGRTGARNFHPTVKSVTLMRYLCRLITQPGGVVLDPFAGSGTTGVAALGEGFSFVGCELGGEAGEYLPILEGRVRAALGMPAAPAALDTK